MNELEFEQSKAREQDKAIAILRRRLSRSRAENFAYAVGGMLAGIIITSIFVL